MLEAIQLSLYSINHKGGPFGAIIIKDDKIIGKGHNKVVIENDPTAHAEIIAIRDACKNLNTFDLSGCELYSICQPCPMCLSAIYWSNIEKVYYANTKEDAGNIGFRDDFIYKELSKPDNKKSIKFNCIPLKEAQEVFDIWKNKKDKIKY